MNKVAKYDIMGTNKRRAAKTMKQVNLFAEETQLERLSKLGDSLERLKIIDFESFRPILTDGLKKERKSNAGRHPFDNVMTVSYTHLTLPTNNRV